MKIPRGLYPNQLPENLARELRPIFRLSLIGLEWRPNMRTQPLENEEYLYY